MLSAYTTEGAPVHIGSIGSPATPHIDSHRHAVPAADRQRPEPASSPAPQATTSPLSDGGRLIDVRV